MESPTVLIVFIEITAYLHTSFYCSLLFLSAITAKHLHYMAVDLTHCRGQFIELCSIVMSVLLPQLFIWVKFSNIYGSLHFQNPWSGRFTGLITYSIPSLDIFVGTGALLLMVLSLLLMAISIMWNLYQRSRVRDNPDALKYSQALKETSPFIVYFICLTVHTFLLLLATMIGNFIDFEPQQKVVAIVGSLLGLVGALCFFLHLLALGRKK